MARKPITKQKSSSKSEVSSADKKRVRRRTRRNQSKRFRVRIERNMVKMVLGFLSIIAAATMVLDWFGDGGLLGEKLNQWFISLVGIGFVAVPIIILWFLITRYVIRRHHHGVSFIHFVHTVIWLVISFSFLGLAERWNFLYGGGKAGAFTDTLIIGILGKILGTVAMIGLVIAGIIAVIGLPARRFARKTLEKTFNAGASLFDQAKNAAVKTSIPIPTATKILNNQIEEDPQEPQQELAEQPQQPVEIPEKQKESQPKKEVDIITEPIKSLPSAYVKPGLKLLSHKDGSTKSENTQHKAKVIERTLQNFGIVAKISEIEVGPSVTRFAFKPTPGMKLSKITNLQNELALALAAKTLRIEAPIPGKSFVGIEVPNDSIAAVRLGTMIANKHFQNNPKPVTVALGRDIAGKAHYSNIAKMPHMLISGATGSGKSVTAHNLVLSLLYRNGPDMLRMIMVDPKRVELTLYNGIPHLLTPVIKDAKRAILALNWAVKEMERRYNVLEEVKVRDIQSYHATIVNPAYKDIKPGAQLSFEEKEALPEKMPYIVVLIDELADIMQLYPRELEASIVRLAQMSRAVGIHLILSTQRPSVNVITGLIKANIPTRLALRVSSQIDSRTILDQAGAETLLGRGDMLFKSGDMANPVRLQSAFVEEEEVKSVVKDIIAKNKTFAPDEIDLADTKVADAMAHSKISSDDDDDDGDELFQDAKDLVIRSGKASTSFIQRKLRVGYSRAARIIDLLEDAGVVGPANGSKPREILTGPSTDPLLNPTEDSTNTADEENEPKSEELL